MRSFSWGRRALSLFVAATGVLLLVSCGGGGSNGKVQIDSVASFGDSLSDLGTYQVGAIAAAGGGRFTTNPAKIWIEYVAEGYGQTITRNRTSGFGTPVAISGGTAYGQGGSRVTSQPGIGNTGQVSGVDTGASTLPITDQITAHLAAVGGVIPPTQLILVLGGDNDIFYQAGVVSAAGGTPASVAAAQTAAGTAGAQLAAQVKRLVAAGAKSVVVLTAFDPAFSLATGGSASTASLFNALTLALNNGLTGGLVGVAGVTVVPSYDFIAEVSTNPGKFGITNVTTPACNIAVLPSNSSLFCSSATLVAAGAENTYLFADAVHPTKGAHALFGAYVLDRIKSALPR